MKFQVRRYVLTRIRLMCIKTPNLRAKEVEKSRIFDSAKFSEIALERKENQLRTAIQKSWKEMSRLDI